MHQSRENKEQTFCAKPKMIWKEKSKKAVKGKKVIHMSCTHKKILFSQYPKILMHIQVKGIRNNV